ncbi:MAG: hypothetical protein HY303_05420 [Candidatus Wallbacteria bacterium]|nr:hypothetical protein [Candidatus Wallbacteria bacterium]
MTKTNFWMALGLAVLTAGCAFAAPQLKTPADVPGYDLVARPVEQFYAKLAAGDLNGARTSAAEFEAFVKAHPELQKDLMAAYDSARADHPGLPSTTDLAALAGNAADSCYRDIYNQNTPGQPRQLTGTEQSGLDRLAGEWLQGQQQSDPQAMRRAELTAASYVSYFPEVESSGNSYVRRMARLNAANQRAFLGGVQQARGGIYDMRQTMREALSIWDSGDTTGAAARIQKGLDDFKASGKTAGAGVDWANFALKVLAEDCSQQAGGGSAGGDPNKGTPDSSTYGGGFTSALSYGYTLNPNTVRYGYGIQVGKSSQDRSTMLAARNAPAKQQVESIQDCNKRKREAVDHGSRVASPIVLDINGDGRPGLYDRNVGPDTEFLPIGSVLFDMDGCGAPERCEWMLPNEDGLLCEDTHHDGKIASGLQLFGTAGGFADGYQKLALRDANKDGVLTGRELDGLMVWIDDGDGVSQPRELHTVAALGITSISVTADRLASSFVRNGKTFRTWDWYTETVPTGRMARR